MKGIEIRMDLIGVPRDICMDGERVATICMDAAREAGATVRKVAYANLGEDSPPGCTCCVLLDESHITAHSYADSEQLALNVFTCGSRADAFKAMMMILEAVGGHSTFMDTQERFTVSENYEGGCGL